MGDAAVQLGSEAADGVIDWSTDTLQDAVDAFPVIRDEVIALPMPDILGVPWVVGPDSQPDGPDPDGDPGPGGPKWSWGKIGALIGLGALLATLLSSSGPLPSPQPNPAPAPLPTPVPTPLPTPNSINILFMGGDIPKTTNHIISAISLGQKPRWLHVRAGSWPIRWKDSRPVCKAKLAGEWCDEYPFASTVEGGQHNAPSLRPAPAGEQSIQGGNIIGFYTACGITRTVVASGQLAVTPAPGSEFLVEPVQWRNTGWVCSNGKRK